MEHEHDNKRAVSELFQTLCLLQDTGEMERFMRDLCTPQELLSLADRWQICKLLHAGTMSYCEISDQTKASLATITRVARFLKDEPYQGYSLVLKRKKVL